MSEEGSLKDREEPTSPPTNYSTFDDSATIPTEPRPPTEDKKDAPVTKQPQANRPPKDKEKNGSGYRYPEQVETEEWSFRLFGCFDEPKLCLATCCLPCYTEARNAEYFHEEELETGIGYCCGACGVGPVMRWRIRQHKKIKGHMLKDVVVHFVCPCCALVQENRELYGPTGSHAGEKVQALKEQ